MGVAADTMTRPLFMAIMVTSWMCIQGRCYSSGLGAAVNCLYMSGGKTVTCTVDYSEKAVPGNCAVQSSYLCKIHKELIINCSNGTGREGLRFDVRNIEEGEYKVSVQTTCGVACTFVNVPLQDPDEIASTEASHSPPGSPAPSRALWGGAGVVAVAVAFIILGILKPKRLCSRLLKLPARDTDVESNCRSSHEEPEILLDTNTDEASS